MPRHSRSPPSRRRSPSPRRRSPIRRRSSPSYSRDRRSSSRDRYRRSPSRHRSRSNDRQRHRSPTRNNRHYRDRLPQQQQNTEIDGIVIRPEESFSDFRTRVRNESTKTIWAHSPERARSMTPDEPRKRHGKRRGSSDDSESESSSEDERRKRRKSRRKSSSRKHKQHKSSRHKSKRKRYQDSTTEESDLETTPSKKPVMEVDQSHLDQVKDLWVEKQVDLPDDLAPVGPLPLAENEANDERAYGGALLPGEGSAMAAYVQSGKRIPRRGEIGLSGDQIADFEKAGYVMSGSRHQRMNAVRLRKENQVISAEEKRLVLQHAQEQKIKRENEIISGFREILSEKFKKE